MNSFLEDREEYINFLENKRKGADLLYKLFDYNEMQTKRHYLREIVTMLRKQYDHTGQQNAKQCYSFSQNDWSTLDAMINTDDANVQDMLLFFTIANSKSMYNWLRLGDANNNHKSYVHNIEAFDIFVKSELIPICNLFMDGFMTGRSNADLDSTVRQLRFKYIKTCGYPSDPINWRREFNDIKKTQMDTRLCLSNQKGKTGWSEYAEI